MLLFMVSASCAGRIYEKNNNDISNIPLCIAGKDRKSCLINVIVQVGVILPEDRFIVVVGAKGKLRNLAVGRFIISANHHIAPYICRYIFKHIYVIFHRFV